MKNNEIFSVSKKSQFKNLKISGVHDFKSHFFKKISLKISWYIFLKN